jgi:hypothetical protein
MVCFAVAFEGEVHDRHRCEPGKGRDRDRDMLRPAAGLPAFAWT